MSLQQFVAVVLVALFAVPVPVRAEQPVDRVQAIKKSLIEIPTGSVISVRTTNKQKFRGKLLTVSDTGFELQTLANGKIESHTLAFDRVHSVKFHEKGMSTTAKVVLGTLAGIGVLFVVLLSVAASQGW